MMKKQEIYNAWREKKRQVTFSGSFVDDVMGHIYQYEQKKRRTIFDIGWFVEFISAHPLARAILVAAGAFTGFIRLVFMIIMILGKGDING